MLQLEAAKSARMRKRFEDVVEGRHRVLASDEDVVADLEKARRRREKLLSAVEDACEAAPHLWPSLERALTLLSILLSVRRVCRLPTSLVTTCGNYSYSYVPTARRALLGRLSFFI